MKKRKQNTIYLVVIGGLEKQEECGTASHRKLEKNLSHKEHRADTLTFTALRSV